jgi:hypothetical protein
MRTTKRQLKNLIKEEVLRLIEAKDIEGLEGGKQTMQQTRSGALAQASAQTGGSFTDEERNLLRELVQLLSATAQKTDLLSGTPAQKIEQLVAVLHRIVGAPEGAAPDAGTEVGTVPPTETAMEEQLVEKIVQSLSQRSR